MLRRGQDCAKTGGELITMTKAEAGKPTGAELKLDTKVTTGGRNPHAHHGYVNTPVYHASTLLYRTAEDFLDHKGQYSYGRRGTPTSEALEKAIQEIEGPACAAVALLPSGLTAISTAFLSVLKTGDHILVTDSVYRPTRKFCDTVLKRYGVTTSYYDPLIGSGIAALMQTNTRVVFTEAPGSLTFEMQDIPAIAAVAHKRQALVLMDNTWASPLYFKALEKGVDLSIQSGTKYIGGHSDLMLGTVSANKEASQRLKDTAYTMGLCVGPDDMNLGLRGLRTLSVRLRHHQSGLKIAEWLERRPEVLKVLHPALPACRLRHLAARLHWCQRAVQHHPQAGARKGRAGVPQRAFALRHGRVLGWLRKPRYSLRRHALSHRDEMDARRTCDPLPYRPRGRERPDCGSRAGLRGAGRSEVDTFMGKPSDIVMMDALALSRAIQRKQVSCVEVMTAYLDHIERAQSEGQCDRLAAGPRRSHRAGHVARRRTCARRSIGAGCTACPRR